jgi:hypothetical protein
VTVYVSDENGDEEQITITIWPDEPGCDGDQDHDWKESDVIGHGGGVITTEVCAICGLKKETDTYAQNIVTGEQGLESVKYSCDD